MDNAETGAQAIAAMVRERSEAGQLISETELLRLLAERNAFPSAEDPGAVRRLLTDAIGQNEDLHELAAEDDSRFYYSSRSMTEAYALILLQKEGSHLRFIAEVVRENSALYPRPVPLDMFTQPPFSLTKEELLSHLERMAEEEEYRDIARTTTSASTLFLYSTRHLEPDHAAMLAEWIDVEQFKNP